MSKKHNNAKDMYLNQDDGYIYLKPKKELTRSAALFNKKPCVEEDGGITGREVRDIIEDMENMKHTIAAQYAVIEALKSSLDISDELMTQIVETAVGEPCALEPAQASENKPRRGFTTYFNGLDIRDVDFRQLIPEFLRNIDGINIDFKPGKGISISPHYRTDTF